MGREGFIERGEGDGRGRNQTGRARLLFFIRGREGREIKTFERGIALDPIKNGV